MLAGERFNAHQIFINEAAKIGGERQAINQYAGTVKNSSNSSARFMSVN